MGKTLIMMERTFRRYENQTIAENYSKYRPTYPQQVWEKIFAFTKKHGVDTKMPERVLKSPGALAVYGYMIPTIRHDQCNKMFYDFVFSKCTWDKECKDGP